VTLVARLEESARVTPTIFPVPGGLAANFQENGLRADIVVLESEWRFAAGQTVRAEGSFLTEPPADSGILALKPLGGDAPTQAAKDLPPFDQVVFGFLPRAAPARVTLLGDFVPQRGSRKQADGLMVYFPRDAETQVLRITVTAF
jgi:hypothetical protein